LEKEENDGIKAKKSKIRFTIDKIYAILYHIFLNIPLLF